MLVAGFVMLGAKLAQRFGAVQVFRTAVVAFGLAQVLMTFSPNATLMIAAQVLCGAAASVIVPSLVALIAQNYKGNQQATAVGALGSARAAAGVLAFVIGGVLARWLATGFRRSDRGLRTGLCSELSPQARRREPQRRDRYSGRYAGEPLHRAHQRRLQQFEPVGFGTGNRQCALQPSGLIAIPRRGCAP
jgi:hypothetical protein